MDEYQKTGFQKFRETKAAIPAGIGLALLVSFLLLLIGLTGMIGGLCIGILAFFVLRLFRVKKIEFLLIFAVLLYIMFVFEMFVVITEVYDLTIRDDVSTGQMLLDIFIVLVLPFLLIAVLTWWMRRNLERTRERLEKEGRLYPAGYGRCKKCGTVVLPGEVCCRKCGEYIDVPEELRVKKVNYFECSECGREVPEDAGVCPYCGEAFEADAEDAGTKDGQ